MNKDIEKLRSQESVRRSREKKKRMLEEKEKEKEVLEAEVNELSNELQEGENSILTVKLYFQWLTPIKYEEQKKQFLSTVKDKSIEELSFTEQETLRKYLSDWN